MACPGSKPRHNTVAGRRVQPQPCERVTISEKNVHDRKIEHRLSGFTYGAHFLDRKIAAGSHEIVAVRDGRTEIAIWTGLTSAFRRNNRFAIPDPAVSVAD